MGHEREGLGERSEGAQTQQSASKPENESGDFRSVDVLAAQVRDAIGELCGCAEIRFGYAADHAKAEAYAALDVLVGYAKRAEELEASLRDAQRPWHEHLDAEDIAVMNRND